MAGEEGSAPPHILAFPLPKQGHINPLLQFSKRLASRGVRVTLLIPASVGESLQVLPNCRSIEIALISDAAENGSGTAETNVTSEGFRTVIAKGFADFISRSKTRPKFIVYDSLMPWILNVAKQFGLDGGPFFTQSCAVNHIYELIHQGALKVPVEEACVSFPSLPVLDVDDLPISFPLGGLGVVRFKTSQFLNLQEAKWLFYNTFDILENAVVNKVAGEWPTIKTIGPAVPSAYLDNRSEEDKSYGVSLFQSDAADPTVDWLHSKPAASVVYVSFGSIVSLEENQVREIACSLRAGSNFFIWVLGESEKENLPSNFLTETSEKGLVVSWCSQLEVLTHAAVGCFVTHCGWNSTLEALSLGVPMVAVPKWSDQTTNAKFIADVWEVGVRAKVNEKGIFAREEIDRCIREVMQGERGKEIRKKSLKWKELAKEAVGEGGSSDKNVDDFVKEQIYSV